MFRLRGALPSVVVLLCLLPAQLYLANAAVVPEQCSHTVHHFNPLARTHFNPLARSRAASRIFAEHWEEVTDRTKRRIYWRTEFAESGLLVNLFQMGSDQEHGSGMEEEDADETSEDVEMDEESGFYSRCGAWDAPPPRHQTRRNLRTASKEPTLSDEREVESKVSKHAFVFLGDVLCIPLLREHKAEFLWILKEYLRGEVVEVDDPPVGAPTPWRSHAIARSIAESDTVEPSTELTIGEQFDACDCLSAASCPSTAAPLGAGARSRSASSSSAWDLSSAWDPSSARTSPLQSPEQVAERVSDSVLAEVEAADSGLLARGLIPPAVELAESDAGLAIDDVYVHNLLAAQPGMHNAGKSGGASSSTHLRLRDIHGAGVSNARRPRMMHRDVVPQTPSEALYNSEQREKPFPTLRTPSPKSRTSRGRTPAKTPLLDLLMPPHGEIDVYGTSNGKRAGCGEQGYTRVPSACTMMSTTSPDNASNTSLNNSNTPAQYYENSTSAPDVAGQCNTLCFEPDERPFPLALQNGPLGQVADFLGLNLCEFADFVVQRVFHETHEALTWLSSRSSAGHDLKVLESLRSKTVSALQWLAHVSFWTFEVELQGFSTTKLLEHDEARIVLFREWRVILDNMQSMAARPHTENGGTAPATSASLLRSLQWHYLSRFLSWLARPVEESVPGFQRGGGGPPHSPGGFASFSTPGGSQIVEMNAHFVQRHAGDWWRQYGRFVMGSPRSASSTADPAATTRTSTTYGSYMPVFTPAHEYWQDRDERGAMEAERELRASAAAPGSRSSHIPGSPVQRAIAAANEPPPWLQRDRLHLVAVDGHGGGGLAGGGGGATIRAAEGQQEREQRPNVSDPPQWGLKLRFGLERLIEFFDGSLEGEMTGYVAGLAMKLYRRRNFGREWEGAVGADDSFDFQHAAFRLLVRTIPAALVERKLDPFLFDVERAVENPRYRVMVPEVVYLTQRGFVAPLARLVEVHLQRLQQRYRACVRSIPACEQHRIETEKRWELWQMVRTEIFKADAERRREAAAAAATEDHENGGGIVRGDENEHIAPAGGTPVATRVLAPLPCALFSSQPARALQKRLQQVATLSHKATLFLRRRPAEDAHDAHKYLKLKQNKNGHTIHVI